MREYASGPTPHQHPVIAKSGGFFGLILAVVLLSPDFRFLILPDTLRLLEVQGQRNPNMEALSAKPAPHRELQKSQTGNICNTHP